MPDGDCEPEKAVTVEERRDLAGSISGLIFELRVGAGAIVLAVDKLVLVPETILIRDELGVLRKLATQSCDALEALHDFVSAHTTPAEN